MSGVPSDQNPSPEACKYKGEPYVLFPRSTTVSKWPMFSVPKDHGL